MTDDPPFIIKNYVLQVILVIMVLPRLFKDIIREDYLI